MKQTDDLIERLAARGGTVAPGKRLAFAIPLVSAALACLISLLILAWPPAGGKLLLIKWAITVPMAGCALAALYQLGHPGRRASLMLALALAPLAVAGALALLELTGGLGNFIGGNWLRCATAIGIFGAISTSAAIYAVRLLAPVRLHHAGFAAGLAGGGIAASAYAPFCAESDPLWLLLFFGGPIMVLAAFGWLAGPRLLRW